MTTLAEIYANATTIINASAGLAADKIEEAEGYIQDAVAQAESERLASLSILVPAPTLPTVPTLDVNQDFDNLYLTRRTEIWAGLESWLQGVMAGWMDQYVPKLNASIQPLSDQWIIDALGGNGLGVPAAVISQIWDRARSRDLQETTRLEQEAIDGYAANGWSLPPGALAARLQALQEAGSLKSSALSRDVAIKEAEIKVDISKLGMELAVRLRLGVAQVIGEFFRAALAIPAQASQDAGNIIEAKLRLQQMIEAYINGKVAVADIEWRWKAKQADVDLGTSEILSKDKLSRSQLIIQASMGGAEAATRIAAAAINSQQTLANVGYSGSLTETT